ncbi:hypothetical protein FJZ39_03125 [Candidatus Saccharibacteria bacterium]|nr:hypothetical protein [Candidatus Saccharibacteria bacterium]
MMIGLIPIGVSLLACVYTVLIIAGARETKERNALLLFLFSLAFWASSSGVALFQIGTDAWTITMRLSHAAFVLMIVCMALMAVTLSRSKRDISGWQYTLATVVSGVALVSAIIPGGVVGGDTALNTPSSFYLLLYLVSVTALLAWVLRLLIINSRLQSTSRAVVAFCFSAVVVCTALTPVFASERIVPYYSLLIVPVMIVFLLEAIRGSLFDLRAFVVRGIVAVASIGSYALLLYCIVFLCQIVLGLPVNELIIVWMIAAAGLAPLYYYIYHFYSRYLGKIFYRNGYNEQKFITYFTRQLVKINDGLQLKEFATQFIARTFSASHVVIYTEPRLAKDALQDEYRPVSSRGGHRARRLPQHDLELLRAQPQSPIIGSLLHKTHTVNLSDLRRILRTHKAEMIFPLHTGERRVGYIFIAARNKGSYSARDVGVLRTAGEELAIALESASLVGELKELNRTLEQRIAHATRELRHSNAQLQKLDATKDEFISMASHQLRTPLTSVKGYIDMVLEGDAGEITPMQRQFLSEAFTSSDRMVHLIADFLNVSRLQTGKFLIETRKTDVKRMVGEELDSLKIAAKQRNLTLDISLPKGSLNAEIDEGKLRQVVMNLVDNALYYSKPDTTVKVMLRQQADNIIFSVKDNGIGIAEEEQAQLFTKFYRASNARRQRPDGTGVGLFMAKMVVDGHGGEMIFSSALGKGSTFGFTVPILAHESTKIS